VRGWPPVASEEGGRRGPGACRGEVSKHAPARKEVGAFGYLCGNISLKRGEGRGIPRGGKVKGCGLSWYHQGGGVEMED